MLSPPDVAVEEVVRWWQCACRGDLWSLFWPLLRSYIRTRLALVRLLEQALPLPDRLSTKAISPLALEAGSLNACRPWVRRKSGMATAPALAHVVVSFLVPSFVYKWIIGAILAWHGASHLCTLAISEDIPDKQRPPLVPLLAFGGLCVQWYPPLLEAALCSQQLGQPRLWRLANSGWLRLGRPLASAEALFLANCRFQ